MKAFYSILVMVLLAPFLWSQQRAIYSNYTANPVYFSPAYVGTDSVHSAAVNYRNQWVGFKGAPTLLLANFQGSVKNRGKMGYGVQVIAEFTGLTQNTSVYGNYAHHFKISESLRFALGLKLGYVQHRIKLYDAQLADQGDNVLSGQIYSASAIDMSSGFQLYSNNFYVMGAIQRILGKQVTFTTYNENLSTHFTAIAGYKFRFKKKPFGIEPSVFFQYVRPVPAQFAGMLKFSYNDNYWLGLMYRSDDAIGFSAGIRIKKRFSINYGYDFTVSRLATHQSGSHEVMLSFIITKKRPTLAEEDDKLNNSIMEDTQQNMKK